MTLTPPNTTTYLSVALAIITVALISTGAIGDGDIWWQMAYGRFFLENGTLIPDHSLFSWTQADNAVIYCAWVAEILFYWVYNEFGLNGLFALRYFAMLLPIALVFWVGKKQPSPASPIVWLAFLICYLTSYTSGGLIKPELFSFMLMAVTVANYFAIKSGGEDVWKLAYVFPLVILLWINTHGGFSIGMVFLALVAIGETVNYFTGAPGALSLNKARHLARAAILTLMGLFCTPYGWDYPLQLFESVFSLNQSQLNTVSAYRNIFDPSVAHLFHPLYLYLSAMIIVPLVVEQLFRRKVDYAVLLVTVLFAVAYVRYNRMTYFYALIMLFSVQYLLAFSHGWKAFIQNRSNRSAVLLWCSVLLMFGLVGHRVIDILKSPSNNSSFSFEISSFNPVTEAEFISDNFSNQRLCNGYTGGGYLLWRLSPEQKVMIDPRYFPYESWFDDWRRLKSESGGPLLSKFECDVWSLNLGYQSLLRSLEASSEWKLTFVGGSSAVYSRKSPLVPDVPTQIGDDLGRSRDTTPVVHALSLLVNNKELKLAAELAERLDNWFWDEVSKSRIDKAKAYTKGVITYYQREYGRAYKHLKKSQIAPEPISNRVVLINANQFLTHQFWERARYSDARDVALEGVGLEPENAAGLFNAGILLLAKPIPGAEPLLWRDYLMKFISLTKENTNYAPREYVEIAESIIQSSQVAISSVSPLRPSKRPSMLDPLSLY